jgi:hypothetical protein
MDDTKVVIHVRFAPNGDVTDIGERPAAVAPQAWYNKLSVRAADDYEPLIGGRGVFRLTRDAVTAIQQAAS